MKNVIGYIKEIYQEGPIIFIKIGVEEKDAKNIHMGECIIINKSDYYGSNTI